MKIYTKEEAVQKSTEYFNGDGLAAEVFVSKYALKNENKELLECTPDQMHRRLAKEFARIEKKYPNPMSEEEIFKMFDKFTYVSPQGSPMAGIGNEYQVSSLSNCFVIDVVDSYGGICRADERIAQVSKRRGGVGMSVSPIRPKGMATKNSALTTDGIVVFMQRFSNTSREVAQNSRRGALMLSISVHHPEVINFIKAKLDLKKVTGANISICVTDEFMEAVKKDKMYEQRWPVDSTKPQVSNKVKAREVWDEIIKCAHQSGEPGVLFWDTIIRNSPSDSYTSVIPPTSSTNPCGELPLPSGGQCILMLQNLTSYVKNPFTDRARFDVDLFKKNTAIHHRLIDDMVDLELEAIQKIIDKVVKDPEDDKVKANELDLWSNIYNMCAKTRRTGMGITGLGDCIAMLNQKYGSKESLETVETIYKLLRDEAYRSSVNLAKERGAFAIWNPKLEKDNEFLKRLPEDIKRDMAKHGRRNISMLTTPPAGSVSTLTQTSSGFEPVFLAEYVRKRKLMDGEKDKPDFVDPLGDKWKEYKVYHHGLSKFMKITGKKFEDSPYFGAQAGDIDFKMRVIMQGVATSYNDHALSSTINAPNNTSKETVDELYMLAWETGCKGVTFYRDGSRDGVLTKESSSNTSTRECDDCDEASKKLSELVKQGHRPTKIALSPAPKRSEVMPCEIHRSKVGGGDWLFFVGLLNGQPYEVFGGDSEKFVIPYKYKMGWIVKNGKDKDGITQYNLVLGSLDDVNEKLEFKGITKHFNNAEYGAFTRMISLAMRHGTPIKYICEQITKTGCEGDLFSFQRAMSRVLKKYIAEGEKSEGVCPMCQSTDIIYKSGCPSCQTCGHSNCS